jgi:hypothetical protein
VTIRLLPSGSAMEPSMSPHTKVLALGPAIGHFLGREIAAWVELADGHYCYDGLAPGPRPGLVDLMQLRPGEIGVSPGLLYRRDRR